MSFVHCKVLAIIAAWVLAIGSGMAESSALEILEGLARDPLTNCKVIHKLAFTGQHGDYTDLSDRYATKAEETIIFTALLRTLRSATNPAEIFTQDIGYLKTLLGYGQTLKDETTGIDRKFVHQLVAIAATLSAYKEVSQNKQMLEDIQGEITGLAKEAGHNFCEFLTDVAHRKSYKTALTDVFGGKWKQLPPVLWGLVMDRLDIGSAVNLGNASKKIRLEAFRHVTVFHTASSQTMSFLAAEQMFRALPTLFPSLKELELRGHSLLEERIQHVVALTQLRKLALVACFLTDKGVKHLLKSAINLEWLHLDGWGGEGSSFKGLGHIKALSKLKRLDLKSCQVTDEVLYAMSSLANLEELSLERCTDITPTGLGHIKALSKLKRLVLGTAPVTDEVLYAISSLTNLEELDLRGLTQTTPKGLLRIAVLLKLKRLELNQFTDEVLCAISSLANLEELTLIGNRWSDKITLKGFQYIAALSKLKRLVFLHSGATDEALDAISCLTNLEELSLPWDGSYTDVGVKYVSGLTSLKKLVLSGNDNLTDQALQYVADLVNLEELNVSYCGRITEEGCEQLLRNPKLRKVVNEQEKPWI